MQSTVMASAKDDRESRLITSTNVSTSGPLTTLGTAISEISISKTSPLVHIPVEILSKLARIGYRWISVAHVCRYWRDVAFSAPDLWRYIAVPIKSHDFFDLLVKSSLNSPLCFHGIAGGPDRDLASILPVISRVERLSLTLLFEIDWMQPDAVFPSYTKGALDAPLLRILEVLNLTITTDAVPLVSPQHPMPLLEHISFFTFSYPTVSSFFRPTLRYLSIKECHSGPSTLEFLQVLSKMPLLETLRIYELFTTNTPSPSPLPIVPLYHLKELRLEEDLQPLIEILDHLLFPPSALVNLKEGLGMGITVRVYDGDPVTHHDVVSSAATKLFPSRIDNDPSNFDDLSWKTLNIIVSDEHPYIAMWRDAAVMSDNEPRAVLNSTPVFDYGTTDSEVDEAAQLNLLRIFPRPAFQNVTTVVMDYIVDPEDVHVRDYSSSLTSLVNLKAVYLTRGMWDCSWKNSATPPNHFLSSRVRFDFPRLRLLSLTFVVFRDATPVQVGSDEDDTSYPEDEPGDPIVRPEGMISGRKNDGMGLERLIIKKAINFVPGDVKRFGAYVEEVKWDGVKGLTRECHPYDI